MEKTLPIILFISAPVIAVVVVALVALKATISDNKEFKKYFMQIIALILLWIGMLLSLYFLNRPLIDKILNSYEVLRNMEKTLFTIVLLVWLLVPATALTAFKQTTFRADLFGDTEFMKYFIRFIALILLTAGVLFISCLLNFPLIDKLF